MKKMVWCAVFLSILWAGVSHAEMRIWTSKKGSTIEAEFVTMSGDKVTLKKLSGKVLKVPVSGLIEADREYLASTIPPKIKLSVDVDVDKSKPYESEWSVYTRQVMKCYAEIEQKNREACSQKLTAVVYVFVKSVTTDDIAVVIHEKKKFSFKEKKTFSINARSPPVDQYDAEYANKRGWTYEGYLIYVIGENGKIIASDANRDNFQKHLNRISKAEKYSILDDNFRVVKKVKRLTLTSGY